MRSGQCSIGVGIVGIEVYGALEEFDRLVIVVAGFLREYLAPTQNILVCRKFGRWFCQCTPLLEARELDRRCSHDVFGYFLLYGKDGVDLGVVCLRPDEAS